MHYRSHHNNCFNEIISVFVTPKQQI